MLKRTAQTVRAIAETAGILAPSVPDAQTAAEQRRQLLVDGQAAIVAAEDALNQLFDAGAAPRDVQAAEATLADARLHADRAQRAYASAEKRLAAARDADAEKCKAAAIVARDAALEIRTKAAQRMEALAVEMAAAVAEYDSQAGALSEAAAAGVAARSLNYSGAGIARHAMEKAGAVQSAWIGSKAEQPGAVALAERDRGAILAGA